MSDEPWPDGALPRTVIEKLFDQMLTKWGKQFIDKWSMVDPEKLKREWGKALGKLNREEFTRGWHKLADMERPPSQPEFLKACRIEVDPLTAYYEAVEGSRSRERGEVGSWSHPAIFHASKRVTAFDLLNQTYSQVKERWETALAQEMAKGEWEEIPIPPKRLAAPPNNKRAKEEAAKMMQHYRESTQTPPPMAQDPKRWAKKIMERHKNGDKTLMPIQVEFARHALRIDEGDLPNG